MLQIKRRIGPKGQIVLPKDIRQQFRLRTGTEIVFLVEDNKISIELASDPVKIVEEFCALPKEYSHKKISSQEIKKSIEQEYEEHYKEWFKS